MISVMLASSVRFVPVTAGPASLPVSYHIHASLSALCFRDPAAGTQPFRPGLKHTGNLSSRVYHTIHCDRKKACLSGQPAGKNFHKDSLKCNKSPASRA